jgi:hypothetical protein
VTGTVGLLLVAAVLSGVALGGYGWRLIRIDPAQPERLIGELRLAQLGAILLAVTAGSWIGLAVAANPDPLANVDVTLGLGYIVLAVIVLHLDPRQALFTLALAFVLHAAIDIAHRPGWLSATLAPRPFIVGCAAYDVYVAAVCFWARRR